MRRMMTCKQHVTWGGKVCYGKLFEIFHDKEKTYAVCNKCQHEYEITNQNEDNSIDTK